MLKKVLYLIMLSSFMLIASCGEGSDAPPPPSNDAVWDSSNWNEKSWQ